MYSTPDPHGSPISRLLRHTRGCGGPIQTWILTGPANYENIHKTNHLINKSTICCAGLERFSFLSFSILCFSNAFVRGVPSDHNHIENKVWHGSTVACKMNIEISFYYKNCKDQIWFSKIQNTSDVFLCK